jgi:hypothetical protein
MKSKLIFFTSINYISLTEWTAAEKNTVKLLKFFGSHQFINKSDTQINAQVKSSIQNYIFSQNFQYGNYFFGLETQKNENHSTINWNKVPS